MGRHCAKGTSCPSKLASFVKTASITCTTVPVYRIHCFSFMNKYFVDHTMSYKNDQHLFDPQLLQVVTMFPTPYYDTQDCAKHSSLLSSNNVIEKAWISLTFLDGVFTSLYFAPFADLPDCVQ